MSYDQIDTIADAYIPALVIVSIVILVKQTLKGGLSKTRRKFTILISCSAFAYGVMFLDKWFSLWPAVGLDYSTHTAVAWVFVVFIFNQTTTEKKINLRQTAIVLSMGVYAVLMLYQGYHTGLDVFSTSLVVIPAFVFLHHANRGLI